MEASATGGTTLGAMINACDALGAIAILTGADLGGTIITSGGSWFGRRAVRTIEAVSPPFLFIVATLSTVKIGRAHV